MKILFVCSGNTCRSPMAAALAKQYFESVGRDDLTDSAGLFANPGEKASEYSVKAMAERNIDISNHRSKQLTPEMVRNADILVPMTDSHANMLNILGVDDSKIKQIGEICDPFGGSLDVYRECADELAKAVKKL